MPDSSLDRRCPACGAANHVERELCGDCGADLDTGEVPPRPAATRQIARRRRSAAERAKAAEWHGHRTHWRAMIAAVVGVLLILAGLTMAGIGPLARPPDVPAVTFDPSLYRTEPSSLRLSDIATRTARGAVDGRPADASMMADDDPLTAWRSDGVAVTTDDEPGEAIDLVLAEPAWVAHLLLRNGDHLDDVAYENAARLRTARISFDGGVAFEVDLLDLGLQVQEVEFPEPILTTMVRIEVLDVFEGATVADLAVSDVEVQGWGAQAGDVDLAARRAAVLPATGIPTPLGRVSPRLGGHAS